MTYNFKSLKSRGFKTFPQFKISDCNIYIYIKDVYLPTNGINLTRPSCDWWRIRTYIVPPNKKKLV